MIRSALLLSVALACAASDRYEPLNPVQGSIGFSMASTTSSNFNLGPVNKSWTDASRGEVYFRSYYPASEGVTPFFEGALFNDHQNYSNYDGKIDVNTFGLGMSFGGIIRPFQQSSRSPIGFGIMPYCRFAFASSDVYIRGLEYENKTIDATGSVGRLDFGFGADLRVTVGRNLEGAIGGGVNFWKSASIDAVVTDAGAVVRAQTVDFGGSDVFLRASVGFCF